MLAKSQKYVLRYKKEEERLKNIGRIQGREEGEQIGIKKGEEKGLQKGREEIARALKRKGVDVKLIAGVSKLSISQIRKL